jgi:ribosomal protein S18 acetylase RimI-like enzyme
MTVRVDFRIRPAVLTDQKQIANLIHFSPYVHRHLDWRGPLDWIGYHPYLVAEDHADLVAALACPPDPPRVAWIRLFAVAATMPLERVWGVLWEAMCLEFAGRSDVIVPAIVLQDWLGELLRASGFTSHQEIVMLARDQAASDEIAIAEGISLRAMLPSDLAAVAEVDAAAFEPVWQNSLEALNRAFPQAILPTVAASAEGVVGYQLSTRNPFGAHLARLAVRPDIQRRGVGRALVFDLIRQLARHGITRLTVNTQSDNRTSLALYQRTGFDETGERYPVYEFPLS